MTDLLDLVPPLHDEWAALAFDPSGAVRNPVTGSPDSTFRLVRGSHRRPGAIYTIGPATSIARSSKDIELTVLELRADDLRRLELSFRDHRATWSYDLELDKTRAPTVEGSFTVDTDRIIREDIRGGCVAWLFRGAGKGKGTLRLQSVVEQHGELVQVTGKVSRFRFRVSIEILAGPPQWEFAVDIRVTGRGAGRLVLGVVALGGSRIRRSFNEMIDDLLLGDPDDLRREIDAAGGHAAYVHRSIWDPPEAAPFGPQLPGP